MYIVDNAVIMAAGTSSRFAPLSYETPKALLNVKGEVLIERQICQLREKGIFEIYVVVGYKGEMFAYLEEKYGVRVIFNKEYLSRNNHSSIYAVKDILKNTYVCSADNYFSENPFEKTVSDSYYAAVYEEGPTKEWCIAYDEDDIIESVQVGGNDAWYMLGHTFWNESFSRKFVQFLEEEYDLPETKDLFWEDIYVKHIKELKMKIRKYEADVIFEFDTLDELRLFDDSYIMNTRSEILKNIAMELKCRECDMHTITAYKDDTNEAAGFDFIVDGMKYRYSYKNGLLKEALL